MASDAHPNELGQFLKLRRAELSPRTVGLPDTGGRRVPGLRREMVAPLAAISTDYYTRLEQGRIQPSASVLAALAQVLRLADDQRDHLFELAGRRSVRPGRRAAPKVHAQLRRLLDDLTVTPGVVIGRRMDILAWNPLASVLLTDSRRCRASGRLGGPAADQVDWPDVLIRPRRLGKKEMFTRPGRKLSP
jgi:transcriptional regulator with XRE-family HTH domain